MSTNRLPNRNDLTAQEARWLAQARKRRGLGEYTAPPSMVGEEPKRCHDCGTAIPANCARCGPCQHKQRRRNQDAREARRQGRPTTTGEWTVRACVGCGKAINGRVGSQREACCQPCRRKRSKDNPDAQVRTRCAACGKTVVTKRSVRDPRCLACRQAQRMAA
jgi:hypothetical protein